MASREERLQQRLRGPQRRQLDEYDEEFNFGIIVPPAAVDSILPPVAQLSPNVPPPILPNQTPKYPSQLPDAAAQTSSANISAKRRKLDTDPPLSTRSTRSSQKTPRPESYEVGEDEQRKPIDARDASEENVQVGSTFGSVIAETPSPVSSKITKTPPRALEEVHESPAGAPGSGRRARTINTDIPANAQLQVLQSSGAINGITPIAKSTKKRKRSRKQPSPDLSQEIPDDPAEETPTGDDDLDELSPDVVENAQEPEQVTPVPQRRRKTKEQPTLGDESPDLSQYLLDIIEKENLDELSPRSAILAEEEEGAVEIGDEEAAVILKKNQGHRGPKRFAPISPEVEEVPRVKRRKGRVAADASPAKQQQPKPISTKPKQQGAKKPRTKSARLGSPIPVTVFRLTKGDQYEEDELDADILNYHIPRPQRGGPNAVDVLAQVCKEVVLASLGGLGNIRNRSQDKALKQEFRTKCEAVESFGRELETRFLEHTSTLDYNVSLRKRLRDEHNKKLDLRQQISQIRAERERIALQMDEVRIKHEKETKKAQSRNDVNSAIHDIELAVDLGKANASPDSAADMVGIELLLKRIAGQVSNKSDSGGLLRQLKEANAFFERTAQALEGRV